ncbi:MAG: hypothetical protein VKO21_06040 [Candidatus Sericytochromatia bacterium]|nr:hypothetical protein [Candidatus Sericytochromatia bacterium]
MRHIKWAMAPVVLLALQHPARAADMPAVLPGLENAPPFVAEVEVHNAHSKGVVYRMNYIPGKMRLESLSGAPNGERQVVISHLAEHVSYVEVFGAWYRVRNDALGVGGLSYGQTGGFRPRKLGRKTVEGRLCDGTELTSPDGKTRVEQWIWNNMPVLATVHQPQGVTTARYRSLVAQRTPDAWFKVPAGAKVEELSIPAAPGAGSAPAMPSMPALPPGYALPPGMAMPQGGTQDLAQLQEMLRQLQQNANPEYVAPPQ